MIRHTHLVPQARSWSRERLEDELGRVHARQFARLLCRAALLRLALRHGRSSRLNALLPDRDCAHWRSAAQRASAVAEIDGFEVAGLLRHALGRVPADWAEPARLIEAALELDPSEGTRWHALALDWFEGREDSRARLAAFAARAACETWRARAQQLLEQREQPPW
jgi:hypothetical protein